ncbi:condensation domain-containing protein [Streptomyces sp. NPDC020377]|uniref:condensation domain-containing protein n=1 Tax=Streptomyces sp. NPDC020377 TaxID=3365070 RepID=UPI00379E7BFF
MTTTSSGPEPLPPSSRQDWCWQWMRSYTVDSVPIEASETLLLRGPLDIGALRDTLADIEIGHEALRLRLLGPPGPDPSAVWPGQTLRPDPGPLTVVPVDGEPEAEAVRVLARPLELTDRMTRATLLRLGPQEHVLVMQFHHLVVDGACHPLIRALIAEGYARRVRRESGPASNDGRAAHARRGTPESYTALIAREWTPDARRETAERADALARTLRAHGSGDPLPGDTDAVDADTVFASVPLGVPADRTRLLLRGSRAERVTLHTVLLAALARAVAEEFGRDRLVGSVYTHGRTTPAAQETLGLFSNVVSAPLDVRPAPLPDFLRAVHDRVQRAARDVDLPFTALAERVLPRPADGGAYCRSALAHLELRLTGVTGWIPVDQQRSSAFPGELNATPLLVEAPFAPPSFNGPDQARACAATLFAALDLADGALVGDLWYERRHHDGTRIARVAERYGAFLAELTSAPRP